MSGNPHLTLCLAIVALFTLAANLTADDWPRWRGPQGSAVSDEGPLPTRWSAETGIRWKQSIPGEGVSSPVIKGDQLFLTSARDEGFERWVHRLDRKTGRIVWSRSIADDNPELTSAVTGYAAPTPVTDGERVVAFFGSGGVVCYDAEGGLQWRRDFGDFESELGIASSPILFRDKLIVVCDHDGKRFRSFDSFLIALDLKTGQTRWKTDRRRLFRSWSTPILVSTEEGQSELVVNGQDELRGYDPLSGKLLWRVTGMTGWVTPSPVFGNDLIFATSGKDGPTLAVRPGGRGNVTETHVAWRHRGGAPYYCSPLWYRGRLYVHTEMGVLTCYRARTGEVLFRQRLSGKFTASGVAGDGKIYLLNEAGTMFVLAVGDEFRLLAENSLGEECLASPAIADGCIFIRTANHLFCIDRIEHESNGQ